MDRRDSSPGWRTKVADALIRYFEEGKWLLEAARLVDVNTETDPDGATVLRATYDHPNWPERTGLRRRLDRSPTSAEGGETPEDSNAYWIAVFEI